MNRRSFNFGLMALAFGFLARVPPAAADPAFKRLLPLLMRGTVAAAAVSSVIAILGSRGGVGTTTLAVNLGATLAADPTHAASAQVVQMAISSALRSV